MNKRFLLLFSLLFSMACSVFENIHQISSKAISDKNINSFITIVPINGETPEHHVVNAEISIVKQDDYVAIYIEPPENINLSPQFLLLKSDEISNKQEVLLQKETYITLLGEVEIDIEKLKKIGLLYGNSSIKDFKGEFGESDIVVFGNPDEALISEDMSDLQITIYESPFPKVKYLFFESPPMVNIGQQPTKTKFISNTWSYASFVSAYFPWKIFLNIAKDSLDYPAVSDLVQKLMCGTTQIGVGPCELNPIREEFLDQYLLVGKNGQFGADLEITEEVITSATDVGTEVILDPEIYKVNDNIIRIIVRQNENGPTQAGVGVTLSQEYGNPEKNFHEINPVLDYVGYPVFTGSGGYVDSPPNPLWMANAFAFVLGLEYPNGYNCEAYIPRDFNEEIVLPIIIETWPTDTDVCGYRVVDD